MCLNTNSLFISARIKEEGSSALFPSFQIPPAYCVKDARLFQCVRFSVVHSFIVGFSGLGYSDKSPLPPHYVLCISIQLPDQSLKIEKIMLSWGTTK